MWLPSQQSTLTELFQTALIKLCSENIPFEGHLELDGLVCISNGDVSRQIVVKIHKVIESKVQKLSANLIPVGRSLLKPYNELFGGSNPAGVASASTSNISSRSLLSCAVDQKKTIASERFAWTGGLLGGRDLLKQSGGSAAETLACINGLGRQDSKPELSNAHSNYPVRILTMETLSNKGSLEYIHDSSTSDQGDKAICLVNRTPTNTDKRQTGVDATAAESHFLLPSPVNSRNSSLPVKSSNDLSILKLLNVEPLKTVNAEIISAADMTSRKRLNTEVENVEFRVKKECLNEGISVVEPVESIQGTDESSEDTPGAPTSCRLCNVPCTGRSLEIHMRYVHKRFLCKICFNAFTLSCNLRRHMKLHAGVRPHACEHCDSSFSRSTDLRIHMRKHGVFESPDSGRNRGGMSGDMLQRQCHLCPKVFTGLSSLNRHLYRTHNTKSSSNRACHICEKVFDSHATLIDHQRTHESSLAEHGGQRQLNFDEHREVDDVETDEEFEYDEEGGRDEDGTVGVLAHQSFQKCDSLDNLTENNNNKCDNSNEESFPRIKREVSPQYLVQDCHGAGLDENDKKSSDKKNLAEIDVGVKYSETMRDFAPLFNIAGDDNDVNLNLLITKKLESTPSSSSSVASSSSNSSTVGGAINSVHGVVSRSKRKGLPMKHVDTLSEDPVVTDTLELSDTSMSATSCGTLKADATFEETNKNETTEECDADRPGNRTVSPGQEELEQKVFTCRHGGCATSWYGYVAYENHYATAHYRFPCSMCDQSFTSRNNRRRHATSHTDGKRHPCETCGKLFARPDIVKEHRLTHTHSYQSGRCRICGVSCEKKVLLLSHLKKCFRTSDDIDEDIPKSEILILATKTESEPKTIDESI